MPTPKAVTDKKKAQFLEVYPRKNPLRAQGEACAEVGITKQCVHLWTCKDEQFKAEYERLTAERVDKVADFLYRVGTDETVKVQMPNVTAAIFMLKNLAPKEFGEKTYREEKKIYKITKVEVIKDYGTRQLGIIEVKEEAIGDNSVS